LAFKWTGFPDLLPGNDKKPDAQNQRESHRFCSGHKFPRDNHTGQNPVIGPLKNGVISHQPYASGDGSVPCPPWMGGTGNRDDSLENRRTSDLTCIGRQMGIGRALSKGFAFASAQTAETPGSFSLQMTAIV